MGLGCPQEGHTLPSSELIFKMEIKTHSWESNLEYYKSFEPKFGLFPMVMFIERLLESDYCNAVYGFTSHVILCIGQHEFYEHSNAQLKLIPTSEGEKIKFEYKPDNSIKGTWGKEVPAFSAFEEFERFLKEMKWVVH